MIVGIRDRKRPMDETWRERIQTGVLLDRLSKHGVGEIEMTATQIKAADILLRKVIPDLKAVELSGTLTARYETMSDEELNAKIAQALATSQSKDASA